MYKPEDIEVIVSFKTPDGKVFNNLSDALSHKPAPLYRMWRDDPELSKTDDLEEAFYVHLPNADAVENFIHDSSLEGNTTEGIDQAGWYHWDSNDFCYHTLPNALGRMILAL
jgi:hypothetical protein